MKNLLLHDIGHSDSDPSDYATWRRAISAGLQTAGLQSAPEFIEFHYGDLFEKHNAGPGVYAAAVGELLASAAVRAVTDRVSDFLDDIFHRSSRDLASFGDSVRWKAGMCAQFVSKAPSTALAPRSPATISLALATDRQGITKITPRPNQ